MEFEIPPLTEVWPSLGGQVIAAIEDGLVFGPGDLRGDPAKVDEEKRLLIWRFYEVYPEDAVSRDGKPIGGRRRFRRCCLSLQKGTAKTEFAAWIAAVELHPEGPVRCVGWKGGQPIGGPVTDPYIPMVAYTEEQSEDLAYGALKVILENSRWAKDFDIGLERIMRRVGGGKAVALAGSPNARDGARTTFAHKDETHRWTSPTLNRAHRTMLANLPKRFMADPWELETTTAYGPGEGSVAEATANYARQVAEGKIKDSSLFYFHRQASDDWKLQDDEGNWVIEQIRGAAIEACGPTAPWRDIDGIVQQWEDPESDKSYLERVWLNRPNQAAAQAFNTVKWKQNQATLELVEEAKAKGEMITLGFDGSLTRDDTALVATHVRTGVQWVAGHWSRPFMAKEWEVPKEEVNATVELAFEQYEVWRMYADDAKWGTWVHDWQGKYTDKVVRVWPKNAMRKNAAMYKDYSISIDGGEVLHDGDPRLFSAIGNAIKSKMNFNDDDEQPMWLIQKERSDSPKKIDAAVAGAMSWQARLDAVASGILNAPEAWHGIYVPREDE